MFSNAPTQFLEVIKSILSRTCFLAYAPELGYSRKNPNRVCWGNTFLKTTLGIFRFVTLPLEIPPNCVTPIGISKAKNQDPWIFHTIFFLIMPGNSTSVFIDSWSSQILFFQSPWKFHVLNPPPTTTTVCFLLE